VTDLLTPAVRRAIPTLPSLPAYLTDLAALRGHAAAVRAAIPAEVELFYAVKANPDPPVLRALASHVDGLEVASGGELAHARSVLPAARVAFGGPGKTPEEIAGALASGVDRLHVESVLQLRQVASAGVPADVLFRANLPIRPDSPAPLEMNGPFGMDPADLDEALTVLRAAPWVRLRGVHAHLASGLEAGALLDVAARVLSWAQEWAGRAGVPLEEVNLGGGMAVDYRLPSARFDWAAYGRGLAALCLGAPGVRLRIEPGRALTAYAGYYATRVLDVKVSGGRAYAVVTGGTHHLRTPAARQHAQPFAVLPDSEWAPPWPRPGVGPGPVTVVGQLCTPKDVLAADVPTDGLRAGDVVVFGMAGAYAWNISHRDFLMHPPPGFHHLDEVAEDAPADMPVDVAGGVPVDMPSDVAGDVVVDVTDDGAGGVPDAARTVSHVHAGAG
jgi:diaminopimelate decarboxylase